MGYESRVTGEIEIKPVISHKQMIALMNADLARKPEDKYYRGDKCAVVEYDTNTEDTDAGRLTSFGGWAIVPSSDGAYKAYTLIEDVQAIVNMLGTETFRFLGYLEIHGEEPGDLWRIYIRDGKATQVEPVLVWPEA
jgi:hypothetical protein